MADKLAEFVAKNGRSFESITKERNPGDTPFRCVTSSRVAWRSAIEGLKMLMLPAPACVIHMPLICSSQSAGFSSTPAAATIDTTMPKPGNYLPPSKAWSAAAKCLKSLNTV